MFRQTDSLDDLTKELSFFRSIADFARDMILVLADDGRICYANQAAALTYGYSLDELRKAILDANPGMPARSLTLSCQGPELAEIRVCTTQALQPTACAGNVRDRCSRDSIRVPSVR